MPNKMKSNNPPRRVEIRGQDHLLAYITPAEAQLLMDNGGTGESGPMGIPAFPEPGMGGPGDSRGGAGNGSDSGGTSDDGPDGGGGFTAGDPGEMSAADAAQAAAVADAIADRGMSPGESQARYGTPAFAGLTSPPSPSEVAAAQSNYQSSDRGFDVNLNRAMTRIAMAPPDQRLGYVDRAIMEAYQTGKAPGLMGLLGFDLGRTQNFQTFDNPNRGIFSSFESQAPGFGTMGFLSDLFGLDPYVTTGFVDDDGPDGDGPAREIVPTQTNPVTGQEECPSGYTFDGDINACRIDAPLENVVGGTGFDYEPGTYARMGLLDVAPEGLPEFAERYGAGYMTPEEFEAANLDYRRRAGTMAGIFQDPYNLSGYTLLS